MLQLDKCIRSDFISGKKKLNGVHLQLLKTTNCSEQVHPTLMRRQCSQVLSMVPTPNNHVVIAPPLPVPLKKSSTQPNVQRKVMMP
jgi:hypothetical protein